MKRIVIPAILFLLLSSLEAQHFIELKVSNDMTYFTDRYFSNGIRLNIYGNFLKKSPISHLLLPHKKNNNVYYALTFTHNIYTPSDTYTPEINVNDHPYATYLLIGARKESFNPAIRTKTTSEFQLGWMGPLAGGGAFQNAMHAHISIAEYVQGWHNQVSNDFCLQYTAQIEKGLIHNKWFETNVYMGAKLGSPHTEALAGAYLRTGFFEPFFRHNGISKTSRIQIWGFCSGDANFIYYNAVLQGGLNNRQNRHTLANINPLVGHLTFGGALVYRTVKIELAQEVITPQFTGMAWHRWAYLAVMVGF